MEPQRVIGGDFFFNYFCGLSQSTKVNTKVLLGNGKNEKKKNPAWPLEKTKTSVQTKGEKQVV